MGLRETLEAATRGRRKGSRAWEWDGETLRGKDNNAILHPGIRPPADALNHEPDGVLLALAPELADEVLELRERHREAMALALDWGNWTRDFLLGDNIDPGDRADLTALLARLDQIGVADETRLGKEQT
jgi:hypothetical protein